MYRESSTDYQIPQARAETAVNVFQGFLGAAPHSHSASDMPHIPCQGGNSSGFMKCPCNLAVVD